MSDEAKDYWNQRVSELLSDKEKNGIMGLLRDNFLRDEMERAFSLGYLRGQANATRRETPKEESND